jgi:ribonuclease HI
VVDNSYVAYFDGACEPKNPGGTASYGAVIFKNGELLWECSEIYVPEKRHETSNNVAEYAALVAVLTWLADHNLFNAEIIVRGDSQLVVYQMFGNWKIKGGLYKPLAHKARQLVARFSNIQGEWIPRVQNQLADDLSKEALKTAGVELMLQPTT